MRSVLERLCTTKGIEGAAVFRETDCLASVGVDLRRLGGVVDAIHKSSSELIQVGNLRVAMVRRGDITVAALLGPNPDENISFHLRVALRVLGIRASSSGTMPRAEIVVDLDEAAYTKKSSA